MGCVVHGMLLLRPVISLILFLPVILSIGHTGCRLSASALLERFHAWFDGSMADSRPLAGNRPGRFHADGHDIRAVVLLVANRGRKVTQQPERHFPFDHVPGARLAEKRYPVLKILLPFRGDELDNRAAVLAARDEEQPAPLGFFTRPPPGPGA